MSRVCQLLLALLRVCCHVVFHIIASPFQHKGYQQNFCTANRYLVNLCGKASFALLALCRQLHLLFIYSFAEASGEIRTTKWTVLWTSTPLTMTTSTSFSKWFQWLRTLRYTVALHARSKRLDAHRFIQGPRELFFDWLFDF